MDSLIEILTHFNTENKCIEHLANIRWPDGPVCQKCGCTGRINYIKTRKVFWCGDCKKQFGVRKNTVFEESRLPLQKWFAAIWLVASHKKGIASTQLAKDIGVTQKTAWFLNHRIREVMAGMNDQDKMFGIVEIDETYHGGKEKNKHALKRLKAGRGAVGKTPIMGMKERGGKVKTVKVKTVDGKTVNAIISRHVLPGSHLMSDENRAYSSLDNTYSRNVVTHSVGQYVKGQAHTNNIENVWSLFKRGVYGIYHYMSDKHLPRYLAEFDTRANTRGLKDGERFGAFLQSSSGHRLTYANLIAEIHE